MRSSIVIISFLIPALVFATTTAQYPDVRLRLQDEKLVLEQENNVYTFPTAEDGKLAGIREVIREDVDGDGVNEYIVGAQLRHTPAKIPYAVVLICKPDKDSLKIQQQIVTGDYFQDIELFDINKDGIKDLVIKGSSGMHWADLYIVAWQNGAYTTLWDTGSPSGVFFEQDKKGNAQIKLGIPLTGEKENWSYADEPDWEIWVWDGNKFAYIEGNTKETRITKLRDSEK